MRIFPYAMCRSAYDIDYACLWSRGYRGIIFDIDNTLVEHNEPATDRAVEFFSKLKDTGFKTAVVSNNREPRVSSFARAVGCEYVYKAGKPGKTGYMKAVERLGLDKETVFAVGDQLFTDIWGASNSGIKSIMVGKIAFHEEIQIYLKRTIEAVIVFIYRMTHKKISVEELL